MADSAEDGLWLPQKGKLEDSYIIGVLVGRGAFSMLYKCLHKGKTERACKVYKKADLDKSSVPEQIKLLLTLSHPHIVTVHEVFETENELQLICDLVKGEELLERIESRCHYSERDVANVVRIILTALEYLHIRGITHGSLYPENVFYESESENAKLKISDFSLHKSHKDTSHVYTVPGEDTKQPTSSTNSPVDIWCLGVLIHIMLCGFEPPPDQLNAQIEENFEKLWSDISSSAKDIMLKLLDPRPSLRLTAREALEHPWVCGETVATKHMSNAHTRIRHFNARRKLRATTHAIIATKRAMNIVQTQRSCCQQTR